MILAEVTFYGEEEGGRRTPPASGFRPQLKAGDEYTSCVVRALGHEVTFKFDVVERVELVLQFSDIYGNAVHVGMSVELYEGSKLIGRGEVVACDQE